MNVSKIGILNVNNTGVSKFSGETSVSNDEKKATDKSTATKFLYGAGVVSAGILALGLAAKYGVFSKVAKDNVNKANKNIQKDLNDFFADKPIAPKNPVKYETNLVPNEPSRADRLAATNPNLDDLRTNIKYELFLNPPAPEAKQNFWANTVEQIKNMSYEDQRDEITYYFDFIKNLDPIELDVLPDAASMKLDNFEYFYDQATKFVAENPKFKEKFSEIVLTKTPEFPARVKGEFTPLGKVAAFLTDEETKIAKLPYDKQVFAFRNYLSFIKTVSPEKLQDLRIFTPGKFDFDNNRKIAEEAMKFVEANPEYRLPMINNLIEYETDLGFGKRLAYAKFQPTDDIKAKYDNHVDNIIRIKELLTNSGFRIGRKAQMINRQDWIDIGLHSINNFDLAFKYSDRLKDIRKAAFELDLKQGITKHDAQKILQLLSDRQQTSKSTTTEEMLGIPFDEVVARINEATIKA